MYEQKIWCQVINPNISRIDYNREGGVFHCDAICSDGYMYYFYVKNQAPPKTFVDVEMYPLHDRVHILPENIP